jgi:class 3 adenylate cyclase
MVDQSENDPESKSDRTEPHRAISIVQRGNLKTLEQTLRKQWRLGQNIVLCWSSDERGLLLLLVPHYFLGNYCASGSASAGSQDNEAFIRELISGRRRKNREELFAVADRLDVAPTFIKLNTALSEDEPVLAAVEQLIKRYGLSYVDDRAVLLFDIVDFSLVTPFEQASQLNSLSYSLNSAYNKLLSRGIEVNFARTTTGDGYYVWNRDLGPHANQDLFYFMVLVVADNLVAREASRGNTVPVIRTAYHIGSHYELYQAEGVNPTVFSYIVGDVTIELARMVDLAQGQQILIGDFTSEMASSRQDPGGTPMTLSTPEFVSACYAGLSMLKGTQLAGKPVSSVNCYLTQSVEADGKPTPRRFRIVDKHGLSRYAYNLQLAIGVSDRELVLGLDSSMLPHRTNPVPDEVAKSSGAPAAPAPTAEELFDDLASILNKRNTGKMTEE